MEGTGIFAQGISQLTPQEPVVTDPNNPVIEQELGPDGKPVVAAAPASEEPKLGPDGQPIVEENKGGEEGQEENLTLIQQLQKAYTVESK